MWGAGQGPGVVASSFSTREQHGREGAAGTESSGPSSTVLGRYRGEGDEVFLKTPWLPFLYLQTDPTANFGDLKEALKQFYKSAKFQVASP